MKKYFNEKIGMFFSKAMYYWKPFNNTRLKKFYHPFIKKNDLCFDIGAHIGNRSQAWLDMGAKVIALEPLPQCVNYLKKRFTNHSSFILIEKAVGAKTEKLNLQVSNRFPTITTLAPAAWRNQVKKVSNNIVSWDDEILIETTTLEELIRLYGNPTFCKIDVEGFEAEVLKGLKTPIQNISFEFFSFTPDITKKCLDELERIGKYEYNWSYGESLKMSLEKWVDAKTLFEHISDWNKKGYSGDIYASLKN